MITQERRDLLSLVHREVIEDHVHRVPPRPMGDEVGQERDELGRGVALGGASEDLLSPRVENGIERQGPMPGILKAVPFCSSGGERQNRIQAIQRLDRRLLIDKKP